MLRFPVAGSSTAGQLHAGERGPPDRTLSAGLPPVRSMVATMACVSQQGPHPAHVRVGLCELAISTNVLDIICGVRIPGTVPIKVERKVPGLQDLAGYRMSAPRPTSHDSALLSLTLQVPFKLRD
jgi:hypothetical protein